MSDTRSQLEEVDALIAGSPDDPSLLQLREDLLQLIALEEQEAATDGGELQAQESLADAGSSSAAAASVESQNAEVAESAAVGQSSEQQSSYMAQGTFMEHIVSKQGAIAEAPDLGSFQPVVYSTTSKNSAASKSQTDADEPSGNLKDDAEGQNNDATTQQQQPEKKKKKKKKKSEGEAVLDAKFELPTHLVPLESDTPAQKLKKQRTAKALKSKFREKQKEAEHAKRQSDWKSFAQGGKKRKGGGAAGGGGSIFSTEEGVDARVGVISGGGGRKMTQFGDLNKRHKFT